MGKDLPLKQPNILHLSDQGVLEKNRKKWMTDHLGETGLDSGIENRRGTETGIEIETGTEVLEGVDVLLVMEGGELVVTKWTGETGTGVGRKMEAISVGEDGRETEIGRETETETAIGTEVDETGEKGEEALIGTENGAVVRMERENAAGGREVKETGAMGQMWTKPKHPKSKGTSQNGQNDEKGPHGGTKMID